MGIDTSILQSASTTGHCLKPEALGESGVSLSVADNLIEPNPGPNYTLDVYRDDGTRLITWGAGSSYSVPAGHYPANSDTTFPLSSGNYYTVLNRPGQPPEIGCCFSVEFLALCDRDGPVVVEFQGDSSGITAFDFNIDVGELDELTLVFTPLTVPDQVQVLDDDGTVIFDSGLVSGSQLEYLVDLTTGNFASGKINVIITSGGAPGQITVFQLAIGCCEAQDCVMPLRHPVAHIFYNGDDCSASGVIYTYNFYRDAALSFAAIGYDLDGTSSCQLSGIAGSPCSSKIFSTERPQDFISFGAGCPPNNLEPTIPCYDQGPSNERVVTNNGTNVTIDYATASAYANAVTMFQALEALLAAHPGAPAFQSWVQLQSTAGNNSNNPCGSDVGSTISRDFFWQAGYFSYNPTGGVSGVGQITLTPTDIVGDPTRCCEPDISAAQQSLQFFLFAQDITAVFNWVRTSNRVPTPQPFSLPVDADGWVEGREIVMGVNASSCAINGGVRTYQYRFNVNDIGATFELWLDGLDTGTLVQQGTPWYEGNATDGQGRNPRDVCRWIDFIAANGPSEGWALQDIDFSVATFDLSFIGGGLAESFADLTALANRISALTGYLTRPVPSHGLIWIGLPTSALHFDIPVTV